MYMCKRIVIFLAYLSTTCYAGINIETSESVKSVLVEAAVQILESCYGDRITAVGLAGNSTEMISKALWLSGSSPIALIDVSERMLNNPPISPQTRHKLQTFIIASSSSATLTKTLTSIKSTKWWNHMAVFLIIDWQTRQDCTNAFAILWSAWELNLLNAKLICYHQTNGRLIYTFNPYTNQAPKSWQMDKTFKGKNDHPWTLFLRKFQDDDRLCDDLDFERTKNLGGYEIRASVTAFGHDAVKSNRACFGVFEDIICEILFASLNATPKVLVHSSLNSIGYVDAKGNVTGILGEVVSGLSDIGLLGRFMTSFTNLTTAYPHYQCELHSLTQYSGYKSQLSKIRSVIDGSSRFCLYLVVFTTVLFFKIVLHESLTVAQLSTFRVICNSSLPKIPGKLGPRIYLGSLFLFALTMQGIYQGKLASLLTKQEPLRNVNNMKDLAELDHTIYGSETYHLYFDDPEFEGRFVGIEGVECTDYVVRNPKAACVGNGIVLIYDAAKLKLHVSRETLTRIYVVLPIRPDWPLEPRVNWLLRRAVEANWIQYLIGNATDHTVRILEIQESEYRNQSVEILTLRQLNFVFAILGIGLGLSTVIFIVEVGFRRSRNVD